MSSDERSALKVGLRSSSAYTVRRSQIVLMSSEDGLTARAIGERLRCSDQCVREAIHAFEKEGVACLEEKTHRKDTLPTKFDQAGLERLSTLVHESPRQYGYPTSLWSLTPWAEVSYQEGLSSASVSHETVRQALKRLGIDWRRAREHITSPDPHYEAKKTT